MALLSPHKYARYSHSPTAVDDDDIDNESGSGTMAHADAREEVRSNRRRQGQSKRTRLGRRKTTATKRRRRTPVTSLL